MRKIILIMLGLCLMVSPCLAFSYDNEAIINPEILTVDETVTADFTMKFTYSEAEILQHFVVTTKLVNTDWTIEIFNSADQNVATKHYKDRSVSVSYFDFVYKDGSTVKIHLTGKVSQSDLGKSINVFTVYTQKAKRNSESEILQMYKSEEMYVFTQDEIQNMYNEINNQIITINAKIKIFKDLGINTESMENTLKELLNDFETFKNQKNPDIELKNKIKTECDRLLSEIKGYENQVVESNLQWAYQNLPDTQLFRDKYNAVLISWQNGEPNMEASIELVNSINNYESNDFNYLIIIIPLGILGVLFLLFKGKKGRGRISHSSEFREDKL